MSTSPDTHGRADDRIVGHLSHWLARHIDRHELLHALEEVGTHQLEEGQAEAVGELVAALRDGSEGGELEMIVRETLEALALGA